MNRNIQHIILLLLLCSLFACGKKRMGITEYQQYLENSANGLSIEQVRNGIHTVFALYPYEWQSFKTSYAEAGMDKAVYEKRCDENKGWTFFSFKVFLPHGISLEEYLAQHYENADDAMLYAEYNLKDDFTLITGTDSLPCTAIHHQPAMGLKPYEEFLLLFKTPDLHMENTPLHVQHNDRVLGLDTLTYSFGAQTMNNIPVLQIK